MKESQGFSLIIAVYLLFFSVFTFAGVQDPNHRQNISDKAWEENLRHQNFQGRPIIEDPEQNILELKAPYTAEDASVVPISIRTTLPQTEQRYIKQMYVFVDMNPMPLVGKFDFTPASGKADLAMRIRVDTFAYVRVVAELNSGELYMTKRFVRAKGACSAPPPASMEDSKRLLGKMKMKMIGDLQLEQPNLMQVKVRHPNITGMAPLKIGSRIIPPAFFMDTLEVTYNDKPIVKALLTFSVSMDPALRFYFVPKEEGVMTFKGTDTKGNNFSATYTVTASS